MHSKLVIAALLLTSLAMAQNPSVDNQRVPQLVVSGRSEVRADPDLATINIGVTAQAKTAQAAQNDVNRKMQAFLAEAKKMVGDKGTIETGRINLYPVYSQRQPRPDEVYIPEIVGYRAENVVVARLYDFSLVGPLVDAGVAAGLTNVESIQFGLRDETQARLRALEQAVQQARAKADVMAKAANVEIVSILELNEGFARVMPYDMGVAAGRAVMAEAAPTPVLPGAVVVNADVTIRFVIRQKS